MKREDEWREEIFKRDGYRCQYCLRDGTADLTAYMLLQIDHFVSPKLGGSLDADNLVTSCAICNHMKAHQVFPTFKDAKTELDKYYENTRRFWERNIKPLAGTGAYKVGCFAEDMERRLTDREGVKHALDPAVNPSVESRKLVFGGFFSETLADMINTNVEIYKKINDDLNFGALFREFMYTKLASALSRAAEPGGDIHSAAGASRPPAMAKPPQPQTVSEPRSKMKFVVLGLVLLAVIGTGIWYLSQPEEQPSPHRTSPSPSTTVPTGQEAGVKAPLANLRPAQREAIVNPKDGLKYVWIPPGAFMMGCSPGDADCAYDEKPPHRVTITKGFWLGQTEVTVEAYKRFAGATERQMPPEPYLNGRPLNPEWDDEAMPIDNVIWDEAYAYCGWAGGRLPTEAEWEYAARAGSTAARYGPIDEVAWYEDNSGGKTQEVGQKRANDFGLYDMLGNVWEWVNDWYDEKYYQISPSQDPPGPRTGALLRLLRGGCWRYNPGVVRVSVRHMSGPDARFHGFGFRCGGEVFAP